MTQTVIPEFLSGDKNIRDPAVRHIKGGNLRSQEASQPFYELTRIPAQGGDDNLDEALVAEMSSAPRLLLSFLMNS